MKTYLDIKKTILETLKSWHFSDSIIIACEVDENSDTLKILLDCISRLQLRLLEKNFLLRGALTIGEIVYKNYSQEREFSGKGGDFVFGKALVEAVQYEENEKYPRVVCTRKILDHIKRNHPLVISDGYIVQDNSYEDYYVDYFTYCNRFPNEKFQIHKIEKFIENNRKNNDEKTRKKYEWCFYHLSKHRNKS